VHLPQTAVLVVAARQVAVIVVKPSPILVLDPADLDL
jgi:hypothetical protein